MNMLSFFKKDVARKGCQTIRSELAKVNRMKISYIRCQYIYPTYRTQVLIKVAYYTSSIN